MKLRPAIIATALVLGTGIGHAAPISNPIAIFAGLDKITGSITTFEVNVGESKRFFGLDVHPRVCNSQPPEEEPKTIAFVEVDEHLLNGGLKRIFTGWMLAESPGLNAVEHPVYDVWLTGCRDPNRPIEKEEPAEEQVDPSQIPKDNE